jgi:hypothetical protein
MRMAWCAQRVSYRRVLEDDGNRQKVEVEQVARWKLLMFSGSFSTRLFVYQDKQRGTVRSAPCPAASALLAVI